MKRATAWIVTAVLFVTLAALPSPAGQSPAASGKEALDVLAKMVEALGGRKVLEAIKDTTITGQLEVNTAGMTLTAPLTMYQKEPNKMRLDITIAEYNMSITQAFDGQKGWYTNPQTGSTEEMPDFMAKEFARQAAGTQTILDPKKAGVVYALKPKAAIDVPPLQDPNAVPRPDGRRCRRGNLLRGLPEGRRHDGRPRDPRPPQRHRGPEDHHNLGQLQLEP